MAGRGYHSYRGRGSRWKVILSIFFLLVILVSVGFLALQRYIVYDENGVPSLELPGASAAPPSPDVSQPSQQPPSSLVIEPAPEVEEETPVWRLFLPASPVMTESEAASILAVGKDTVAVTVKDEGGLVYFPCEGATASGMKEETAKALGQVVAESEYSAARIHCFLDPKASYQDARGKSLLNTSGYMFKDALGQHWLDPGKAAARDYLVNLITQCAALGFDEIILASVSYPTEGKLHQIRYGELTEDENLALFLQEVKAALEPYGVTLTVELTANGILLGKDPGGLTMETAVQHADRICAATTKEEAENLETILRRYSEDVVFVPMFTQMPFAYEGNAILLETTE